MSTLITRRPQRGTAYARSVSYSNDHWNNIEEPGGRKLWMRLVIGFSLLAVIGTVLLALGAVLFQHAYDFHEEGHTALPMVLCIISMVCGILMFFGSIILGNMVISSKWRKNQKPDYSRANRVGAARVRYTIPADGNGPDHVEIDLPPPPYDSGGPPAPIFFVNGDLHVSTNMPPPPELRLKPPEYGDVSDKPPSYSSLCKVHTSSSESSNLPTNVEQADNTTTNGLTS